MNSQRHFARFAEKILLSGIVCALCVYAADWAVFTIRGKPLGSVVVERYLQVPLKGNKTEYDGEGERPVPCSRSFLPQSVWIPCWYLTRHSIQADKL
uniref:Uncharacterized protein n=1 Tax=mine drainage metagenome TaxID=410659 RepID=E6QKZ9_9ZZZZ